MARNKKQRKKKENKNPIKKTQKIIDKLTEKENLNKEEKEILDYILSFIKFRILVINGAEIEKIINFNSGDKLLKYFDSEEDLKALNANITYKDLETNKIRNKKELKQLKKSLSRK